MGRSLSVATWALCASCALSAPLLDAGPVFAADAGAEPVLKNRTIGYVITDASWAVYQTPEGKAECPQGLNEWGPREQFKALFPNDGTTRTLKETQLAREAQVWHPAKGKDPFPYMEASGPISYGLNLDGKIGPSDFTNPDGERGVDNQLYRAIGCNENFRGPTGIIYHYSNLGTRLYTYSRVMLELTNVDDLTNDPDVDVTILRGRDRLLTDATGERIIPGGTQRIDTRFAKKYIQHLHGEIVDGVLTTDPVDIRISFTFADLPSEAMFLSGRFRLKLTPERAEGVAAGYSNIDRWYYGMVTNSGTVFLGYGRMTAQSFYKKLYELADGYPDASGANTAVSSAMVMKFAQVFIEHLPKAVASQERESLSASAASPIREQR